MNLTLRAQLFYSLILSTALSPETFSADSPLKAFQDALAASPEGARVTVVSQSPQVKSKLKDDTSPSPKGRVTSLQALSINPTEHPLTLFLQHFPTIHQRSAIERSVTTHVSEHPHNSEYLTLIKFTPFSDIRDSLIKFTPFSDMRVQIAWNTRRLPETIIEEEKKEITGRIDKINKDLEALKKKTEARKTRAIAVGLALPLVEILTQNPLLMNRVQGTKSRARNFIAGEEMTVDEMLGELEKIKSEPNGNLTLQELKKILQERETHLQKRREKEPEMRAKEKAVKEAAEIKEKMESEAKRQSDSQLMADLLQKLQVSFYDDTQPTFKTIGQFQVYWENFTQWWQSLPPQLIQSSEVSTLRMLLQNKSTPEHLANTLNQLLVKHTLWWAEPLYQEQRKHCMDLLGLASIPKGLRDQADLDDQFFRVVFAQNERLYKKAQQDIRDSIKQQMITIFDGLPHKGSTQPGVLVRLKKVIEAAFDQALVKSPPEFSSPIAVQNLQKPTLEEKEKLQDREWTVVFHQLAYDAMINALEDVIAHISGHPKPNASTKMSSRHGDLEKATSPDAPIISVDLTLMVKKVEECINIDAPAPGLMSKSINAVKSSIWSSKPIENSVVGSIPFPKEILELWKDTKRLSQSPQRKHSDAQVDKIRYPSRYRGEQDQSLKPSSKRWKKLPDPAPISFKDSQRDYNRHPLPDGEISRDSFAYRDLEREKIEIEAVPAIAAGSMSEKLPPKSKSPSIGLSASTGSISKEAPLSSSDQKPSQSLIHTTIETAKAAKREFLNELRKLGRVARLPSNPKNTPVTDLLALAKPEHPAVQWAPNFIRVAAYLPGMDGHAFFTRVSEIFMQHAGYVSGLQMKASTLNEENLSVYLNPKRVSTESLYDLPSALRRYFPLIGNTDANEDWNDLAKAGRRMYEKQDDKKERKAVGSQAEGPNDPFQVDLFKQLHFLNLFQSYTAMAQDLTLEYIRPLQISQLINFAAELLIFHQKCGLSTARVAESDLRDQKVAAFVEMYQSNDKANLAITSLQTQQAVDNTSVASWIVVFDFFQDFTKNTLLNCIRLLVPDHKSDAHVVALLQLLQKMSAQQKEPLIGPDKENVLSAAFEDIKDPNALLLETTLNPSVAVARDPLPGSIADADPVDIDE